MLAAESLRPTLGAPFGVYAVAPFITSDMSFAAFAFAAFYLWASLARPERLHGVIAFAHFWLAFVGWGLMEAPRQLLSFASMHNSEGSLDLFTALNTAASVGYWLSLAGFAAFVGVVVLISRPSRRDHSAA